ncbi:Transposase [Phytophthora megakarya]|uniref:Transposase n=1 Tax=Phytophthora megakarya TaxID=4795 RepID=A0A225UKC7_9STRA|nr:Transposase [Phytophthora megakarya]
MTLRRFKQLSKAFCFKCVETNSCTRDQAARIRPLLNLLKTTGSKYVEKGRNVALDEASVDCRSKYGKPLIVYNPMKPTGKYHFRLIRRNSYFTGELSRINVFQDVEGYCGEANRSFADHRAFKANWHKSFQRKLTSDHDWPIILPAS